MKRFTSTFKPHKTGLGRVLGDLEKSVMDVLWEKGEVTGRGVFEEVGHGRALAFTTILTVIDRLLKKGLVKRVKKEKLFVYTASMSRDDFVRKVSQEVLQGIFDISASSAATSFIDILYKTSPEEIDRLSRLIEERKKVNSKK